MFDDGDCGGGNAAGEGCCCERRRARVKTEATLGVTAPSELRRDGVVTGEVSAKSCRLGGGLEVERCEYTCEESGCRVSWNVVAAERVRVLMRSLSGNEVV